MAERPSRRAMHSAQRPKPLCDQAKNQHDGKNQHADTRLMQQQIIAAHEVTIDGLKAAASWRLSAASVFRVPASVIVRFSNFTGLPDIPDFSPNASPRGMAVKFLPFNPQP